MKHVASAARAPAAAALRAPAQADAPRSRSRAAAPRRARAVQTRAFTFTEDGQKAYDAAQKITPRDDLPEVLVAGGGIAGLITALSLQRKGMKVKVFEKVKEYKLFGGPIQLQCNAQGALDSIAPDVLEQIWEKSTIIVDRERPSGRLRG